MPSLPDPRRSRAVLIGISTYTYLDNLPAVRNNVTELRAVLTDPALGGLPADKCRILNDPPSPVDLYRALRKDAEAAEDTLLVYFAGHGLTGGARNELFLCLPDSHRRDELSFTGLAYEQVREAVGESRAIKKVVILDCCFSGRALATQAGYEDTIVGQVGIEGTYILTATPRNAVALAPPGARYTAFTGALLELLRTGIPGGPELLTPAVIFPTLKHTLTSRRLPPPHQQGSGTITHLAFARNTAYAQPRTEPEPARTGQARILAEALQAAQAITEEYEKNPALADIAQAVAITDPDRAERIAQEITDLHTKERALAGIANELAATDPDRAERIAWALSIPYGKAWALACIAEALAVTDPDRARGLVTDAERIARATFDAVRLADIARVVAATDPDRAKLLADDAERIARTETEKDFRGRPGTLAGVARAIAATDPDRAERIIQSIRRKYRAYYLAQLAEVMAATNPDRAERIARATRDQGSKASILAEVARAVAATDPGRAKLLAADAERIVRALPDQSESETLARIADTAIATDPERAERIALTITDKPSKAEALAKIAKAMAATSPNRAM